jgi:soluble lytic murein transglycosylase
MLVLSVYLSTSTYASNRSWPMSDQAVTLFKDGWSAASMGDQAGLGKARAALAAYDSASPLIPYLDFEALRQQGASADEEEITRFLAKHRHWSFANTLALNWLRALGATGQYEVMARYVANTKDTPLDETIRCHLAQGQVSLSPGLGSEAYEQLMAEAQSLWLVGYSQDDACDPVFAWWRRQGQPDATVAWSRFLLAIQNNERSLAGYLQRYLSPEQREWATRWLLMQRYPQRALNEARRWGDHRLAQALIEWGLMRLARQDWSQAKAYWSALSARFAFDELASARIAREIALFQAVSLDVSAIAAIDQLPPEALDGQILAWKARVAMAHGQWAAVLASIEAMPVEDQSDERWRYWRGRALAELGRPDAILAYASVSNEANYYGFLSAQKLGQPLSLCPKDIETDEVLSQELWDDQPFQRALSLQQVGLYEHARWTWYQWMIRLPTAAQQQAALLATKLGWHDRAIATMSQLGTLEAYALRFPIVFESHVMAMTEQYEVDPALVYGLMRAESALQVDAHSHAGARGLLQLMPSTARAVARRQGIRLSHSDALWEPEVNITLGVAHLAELEERFDRDWVKVAAAYNAGANAVERWMERDGFPTSLPTDVWIETLPFYETRDYVPRVLAFATIYEWQLDREPQVLANNLTPNTPPTSTAFVCAVPE